MPRTQLVARDHPQNHPSRIDSMLDEGFVEPWYDTQ